MLVRNLNKIIDVNWYPVEEAQKSNVRHRPMGIGVQGLADTFIKVRPRSAARREECRVGVGAGTTHSRSVVVSPQCVEWAVVGNINIGRVQALARRWLPLPVCSDSIYFSIFGFSNCLAKLSQF